MTNGAGNRLLLCLNAAPIAQLLPRARVSIHTMKMQSLVLICALCLLSPLAPLALAKKGDGANGGQHWEQKMANLSPTERDELRAAHAKAMKDPAVRAAKMKMKQARRELREAMKAAMLKSDPAIQPVLEKMLPYGQRGS